ncbi:MAG: Nucleoside diphosphate kinase [Candidatus Anoxychlamydiales bacterium]|nr:Nucleoside diphosphate kinase [Candidatus Anoxychlamydiales bacterium]
MEQTLSIIKPDAIEKNVIGKILKRFEKNNLKIIAAKMLHLTKDQAQKFYLVHKDKPFYNSLVDFMTSGPILVSVLDGDNAVSKNREIMGATNPENADEGTIRKDFATSIEKNAVHGSDSLDNAKIEISFFFKELEIFSR